MGFKHSFANDDSDTFIRFIRYALEHLSDGAFWFEENGRLIYVNEEACRSLGRPEAELLELRIHDIAPDVTAEVWRAFWARVKSEGRVRLESTHRRADGSTFPVEVAAQHVVFDGEAYCCAFARDIAERKAKEELLRFTQFSVDNFGDAAYWILPDASISYVNQATCDMLGYTREELLQKKVYEIGVGLDETIWAHIWAALKVEKRQIFEAVHQAKDGRLVPVEISTNLMELEGREFSCAFARDIAERKDLEMRLRQSEKMEGIGRLAGGVAHDFNNQLAGILGYVELLREDLRGDAKLLRYVDMILTAVTRASDLTSQLLAFSRKGKYHPQTVDLNDLVSEVVQMLRRGIDKRIDIVQHKRAVPALTVGDSSQLQNAVLNLALNARDAIDGGGVISLGTEVVFLDREYCQRQSYEIVPGSYLRLTVRDTGRGMDRETSTRMFEPFFTTKDEGKGTGMGLAAVYGTVKNHKGAISVYSEPGRGTAVSLYLPMLSGEAPLDQAPREPELPIRAGLRIFVVDDEPTVREVTKEMLERLGAQVRTFENGQQALDDFRESWRDVDVVVLDMVMPVMNGYETYLAMKKIDPSVRVLLASGYALDNETQSLLNQGVSGFLQKPFSRSELAGTIETLMTRKPK